MTLRYRASAWALLLSLLWSSAPTTPVTSSELPTARAQQTADPIALPAVETPAPPPAPIIPLEDTARKRPALAIDIAVAPDPIAVGETAIVTLTLQNSSPITADSVQVELPLPSGVLIVNSAADATALLSSAAAPAPAPATWTLPKLAGNDTAVVTTTIRLTGAQTGSALVLQPTVNATDLVAPASRVGGALIVDRGQGQAQVDVTPGQGVTLRSPDGAVTVTVPTVAADRARAFQFRTLDAARSDLRDRKVPLPDTPGLFGRSGLAPFVLDAFDAAGQEVRTFPAPLTIDVQYTAEQLAVRGLNEESLRLAWFDEQQGTWVSLPSVIDSKTKTVRAIVDHFTVFTLSDGSSPSKQFVPDLQGFQVSAFTGAATYRIPMTVPAGPGGLAPSLELSYSSAASDGSNGMRDFWQAGWVGKGWSLSGGGSIARVRNAAGPCWDSFSLVLSGRSYDIVKGRPLSGSYATSCTTTADPARFTWQAVDETFDEITAIADANVRGGFYWQVRTKDGTRYTFKKALVSADAEFNEPNYVYQWLLTQVTDVNGNKLVYTYYVPNVVGCDDQTAYPILPIWYLQRIEWAYDGALVGGERTGNPRYKVEFGVENRQARGVDVDWEYGGGTSWKNCNPHEVYTLRDIIIWSQGPEDGAFQRVRRYALNYADAANSVWSDSIQSYANRVLTLTTVQELGATDAWARQPHTFTYKLTPRGTPGSNRITGISNGYGGEITIAYAFVWPGSTDQDLKNIHRVTEIHRKDISGKDYSRDFLTTYGYGTPAVNDRTHSAMVTYSLYPPGSYTDSTQYLAHPEEKEFRGHDWVDTFEYAGSTNGSVLLRKTYQEFYRGDNPGCTAVVNGDIDESGTCFQTWLKDEAWKGRPKLTRVFAGDLATLQETVYSYGYVPLHFYGKDPTYPNGFADSGGYPRAGLWRAFTPTQITTLKSYERTATPVLQTTEQFYGNTATCTQATSESTLEIYGNLRCVRESNHSGLVRETRTNYAAPSGGYFVTDRVWRTSIYDASGYLRSVREQFYDNVHPTSVPAGTSVSKGLLTLDRLYTNVNLPSLVTTTQGKQLTSRDVVYGYDSYGNKTTETTYNALGIRNYDGTTITYSSPGNGSSTRVTTTSYNDDVTAGVDETLWGLPHKVTNALLQTESARYDFRWQAIKQITDANSQVTSATYDGGGRLQTIVKPYDTANYTTYIGYDESVRPLRYIVRQRQTSIGGDVLRDTHLYYDGFGNLVQRKVENVAGDQGNTVVDYRYDAAGRQIQASQPRAVSEANPAFWYYTPWSATAGSTADLHRPTKTTYDALDRPLVITYPDTTQTSTTYTVPTGSSVVRTTTRDQNLHQTSRDRDTFGRLATVVEFSGESPYSVYAVTSYQYDPLDQLTTVTATPVTGTNIVTSIAYDSAGRKVQMTDPDTGTWSYAYHPNGTLQSQTDAKSQTTTFSYDALDRLTSVVMPGTPAVTRSYVYDDTTGGNRGKGRRTEMKVVISGTNQSKTTWTYDDRGRKASATHTNTAFAGNKVFSWAYDSADQVQTITYPHSEVVRTWYTIDGNPARLCSISYQSQCTVDGAATGYVKSGSYTALNQPDQWLLGNDLTVDWTYTTPMARLDRMRVFNGASEVLNRSYAYDNVGNVTRIWNNVTGEQQTQRFTYDHRDRLLTAEAVTGIQASTTSPLQIALQSPSDLLPAQAAVGGLRTTGIGVPVRRSVVDVAAEERARQQVLMTDALAALDQVERSQDVPEQSQDLPERAQPPAAPMEQSSIPTTGLGLWLKADTLSGTAVSTWADQSGNSRNATQTTGSNQPTLVSNVLNGQPVVRFDGAADFLNVTYGLNGLTGMTVFLVSANQQTTVPAHEAYNAPLFWNETTGWGATFVNPRQAAIKARFGTTQASNNLSYTRPANIGGAFSRTTVVHDGANETMYVNGASVLTAGGKLTTLAGISTSMYVGRGLDNSSTPTYFNGDIAEVIVYGRALNTTELQQVESYLESKYFPTAPTPTPTFTPTPTPPPATSTPTPTPLPTPPTYSDSYSYDLLGNLINKDGTTITYGANGNATGAGPHQARNVGGQVYTYDANGNLTSGGGRTYTWTVDNRPATITSGGVTESYTYDADGARVTKTRSGVVTVYLEGLWEETTGTSPRAYYYLGGQLVATRNTQLTYVHSDHLGSVSVSTDESRNVLSRVYYDSWGKLLSGSVPQTKRSYTGQYLDDTGLLFYNARYYDPVLGRFISADTIVPDSGPLTVAPNDAVAANAWAKPKEGGAANPQDLNRYAYVLNNPVKNTDPTGHCYHRIGHRGVPCPPGGQAPDRGGGGGGGPKSTGPRASGGASQGATQPSSVSPAQIAAAEGASSTQALARNLANTSPRPPQTGDPKTVAVMRAPSGNTYGGRSGFSGPTDPKVQEALDNVPASERSVYHGRCAEVHCLNQAAEAGETLSGGHISTARVRGPNSEAHGTPIEPCSSCASVLRQLGVRYE